MSKLRQIDTIFKMEPTAPSGTHLAYEQDTEGRPITGIPVYALNSGPPIFGKTKYSDVVKHKISTFDTTRKLSGPIPDLKIPDIPFAQVRHNYDIEYDPDLKELLLEYADVVKHAKDFAIVTQNSTDIMFIEYKKFTSSPTEPRVLNLYHFKINKKTTIDDLSKQENVIAIFNLLRNNGVLTKLQYLTQSFFYAERSRLNLSDALFPSMPIYYNRYYIYGEYPVTLIVRNDPILLHSKDVNLEKYAFHAGDLYKKEIISVFTLSKINKFKDLPKLSDNLTIDEVFYKLRDLVTIDKKEDYITTLTEHDIQFDNKYEYEDYLLEEAGYYYRYGSW